jgi:energy-coupling factor transporter ATP-binding protein EcfA2
VSLINTSINKFKFAYSLLAVMDKCYDFSLKEDSSMLVCGPTMSGKSTFVHALLNDKRIFDKPPERVYWFHGQMTDELKNKTGYFLKEGLPDSFEDIPPNSVIVLDDLMHEAKDHPGVTKLFTKLVHHKNLFVINITQNFFLNSKETRTRRLNTQYIVLFKNPSDATQVQVVGRQMYPNAPNYLAEVNRKATKRPHGYIFIDLRQETPDEVRIRSNILPSESPMRVYKQNRSWKRRHVINKDG